jgi:hypothetical protein
MQAALPHYPDATVRDLFPSLARLIMLTRLVLSTLGDADEADDVMLWICAKFGLYASRGRRSIGAISDVKHKMSGTCQPLRTVLTRDIKDKMRTPRCCFSLSTLPSVLALTCTSIYEEHFYSYDGLYAYTRAHPGDPEFVCQTLSHPISPTVNHCTSPGPQNSG